LGEGRVICIGSYEMFRDNTKGGFQYSSHSTFGLNLFKWLISDFRVNSITHTSSKLYQEELSQKEGLRLQKEPSNQEDEILRSRQDIETELNALRKKLTSTKKILNYVEKKKKSGDLTEETYQSRSEKLHSQINELNTRIQTLKKALQDRNYQP
jgi:predicted  nucleic acid-binding Zn-ribbon protein